MDQRVSGEIDTQPRPAVQSLRSRFEQLAVDTSGSSSHSRGPSSSNKYLGYQGDLLTPTSPRPRASSNTYSNTHVDIHHLRSSSSSSDLKTGVKRPPPPPPSRGSKGPSGSPIPGSPLLRPVPVPPSSNGSPRLGPLNLPTNGFPSLQEPLPQDSSIGPSVASLRHKL